MTSCLTTENNAITDQTVDIYGNIQSFRGYWNVQFEDPSTETFMDENEEKIEVNMLHLAMPNKIRTAKLSNTDHEVIEVNDLY